MSRFLNNLCEDLVNSSNPRYAGAQITPAQQVAWQLKKEEDSRQALYAESSRMHEAQSKRDFTPPPAPTYTAPSYSYTAPPYTAPSYSYTAPSYTTPSYSYSAPSYSYSAPSFPTGVSSHLDHLKNLSGL